MKGDRRTPSWLISKTRISSVNSAARNSSSKKTNKDKWDLTSSVRTAAEIVEQVLSRAIDDLEPTLTRTGYDAGALASQLNTRPPDIRPFLAGTLMPDERRVGKKGGR